MVSSIPSDLRSAGADVCRTQGNISNDSLRSARNDQIVYAFIDSQNLNLAILDQGWELDFVRFRRYLKDKYTIAKAILFMGYITKYEPMYSRLRSAGFAIVFKPIVKRRGEVKGNIDAELVLHAAAIEFGNYDKALIVTGDGDFLCLIEYLEQQNKLLRLMVPNYYKYSSLLRRSIRNIVFMNNLKQKLNSTKKRGINLRTKP